MSLKPESLARAVDARAVPAKSAPPIRLNACRLVLIVSSGLPTFRGMPRVATFRPALPVRAFVRGRCAPMAATGHVESPLSPPALKRRGPARRRKLRFALDPGRWPGQGHCEAFQAAEALTRRQAPCLCRH